MSTVNKTTVKPKKLNVFSNFLKLHSYDKSKHPFRTNTRIPDSENGIYGGCYYFSEEEYSEFMQMYGKEVVAKNKCEYLTETQLDKDAPILVDIDMRFDTTIKTRQYTSEHKNDLLDIYLETLKEIYQFDEETQFPIYILEKPNVNCLEDKTKDGIHMIIGIQSDRTTQILLRKKILPKLKEVWENSLPLTNTWEDVLDEGISIGHTNWQMYGSKKPNHDKYELTNAYTISFDITDQQFQIKPENMKTFNIQENLFKLSARYSRHYSTFFKNKFADEYAAYSGNTKKTVTNEASSVQLNHRLNPILLNIGMYASISNREQLDACMNEFLEQMDMKRDSEPREIYEYVMTLPVQYYGENSYAKWIRVGWCLKRLNPLYFIIWAFFSAQSATFDFGQIPELYSIWERANSTNMNVLNKRSLMYWSKTDAFEKYSIVRENTIDYYIEKTIDSSLSALASSTESETKKKCIGCGEADLAEVLYQLKTGDFVCVSVKDNIWYQYQNHRWSPIDSGTTLRSSISNELRELYWKKADGLNSQICALPEGDNRLEKMKNRLEKILAIHARLGKTGDKKNIMIEAKDRFYDGEFLKRLDMNPYLMCFKNGVWDFKEGVFRPGKPDDYLSITTGIDYIANDPIKDKADIEEVSTFFRQLFPISELEKYMWQHLASTLIGVAYDQTFNNYIGGGSNGKSVLTNLMGMILGGYKYDLPHTAITSRERTKVGGLAPEIVALKGKRYVVMAEPSKGDVINEGIMKQFTAGNDKITARAPYMLESLEFIPQFKLCVCANQTLKINTTDHGTWRRMRLVEFMSLFTNNPVSDDPLKPYQFKLIPDIEKKFDGKFKYVFMSMLVEIVLKTKGKVDDCPMVMAASDRYRQSQDVVAEFISEIYEISQGAKILNKTCVSEDFKRWHNETYGTKGPQPKEVHEYMDKKFGKTIAGKWQNVKKREINMMMEDSMDMGDIPEINIED
jgi:P4 family phage/plasmid primase-like protien